MSEAEEIWINLPRSSDEYINGVKNFVKNAMAKYAVGTELKCPCGFEDKLNQMLNLTYTNREPNSDARKFYRLVEDGKQPLYPGSKNFSRLSFLVRLYHWKCLNGVTQTAFGEMLQLLKEAFPDIEIPTSFNSAKNNEVSCKTCGVSRWRDTEEEHKKDKIPTKVMRYFSLKPRLQRMYMCKEFAKLMTWHVVDRKKDGMLRHPADGVAWKIMDAKCPTFSSKNRNIRLGIASDGFNPFSTMSGSHSTRPVVVVNYNLPPWLNMKPENLILSTLIPGPTDPGNSIDVYLQPLVEELKELWDVGVTTFDAAANQNFVLRASVLWTISDFPGYAMLSGWSTKGYLACPICNYETSLTYLKHSRKVEVGQAPAVLSGRMIKKLLDGYQNTFGKVKGKRKVSCDVNPWNKKSIFFHLPYWSENSIRHNPDIMHIEKNICDSILGTLLNISGKTKDHVNARLDLQEMGIRKILHPTTSTDGKYLEIRAANFDKTNKEKDIFCSVLKNVKFPHGFASNNSKCVQDRKVVGYKSHDAHIIMQYLLQIAVKKALKPEVTIPLIRLGEFFRGICSKVIEVDDVKKLQKEIIEILCRLEINFPPAFFDIMVHLPVHLCNEIELGGPVHQRWMYSIERYLGKLKRYIRNKSQPKGSIAEGYLADECVTFCARFIGDNEISSVNELGTRIHETNGYPILSGRNQKGKAYQFPDDVWTAAHRYILFNYDDKEVEALIEIGGDFMTFNLHHKGEFHKNKYAGGTVNTVKDFEFDVFSYSELMEWVNQLGYKEIGGIYVQKEENSNGWELITDDAALNEPKRSPVNPKEDNPKKRQFVTLKDINEEKTRKMNKSRKKAQSTDKVSKAVAIERKSNKSDLMGMVEYMKRFEIPDTNKNLGEGAGEGPDGGNALNAYEMQRNKNVEENMKKIKELGIKPLTRKLIKKKDVRPNIQSDEDETEYRCPEKDLDRESNEEEHIGKKKAEKVVAKTDGPKTRSRTSKMSIPCDKPVNTVEPEENDASEVPIIPIVEKLKQLKNHGPGTMERYLELREREKEAEMEGELEAEMEVDAPAEKIKKPRGKSKMKHVHTRGEKREIVLSKLGQPISDDDRLLSEFSNFLGITDKYIISKEGYKYVMTTMCDQSRGYKASIKKDHYSKYDTDELRLQNRPREVPLKDFKILLNYWGDEKVQKRARKNAEAQNKITETHTVGPRSFAQVCHKMAIKRERLAKPDEQIVPISDADVYVKTRKRDAKREYKLPTDVVEKKIEDVKKNLKDGNIDAVNELVRAGKEHSRSYLVGRLIQKKESKGDEEKMDWNVRELRDSIKVMMSKLAEKNPELQIDIEEQSKLQPPSEQTPSDATGTSKQPPSDATEASNSSP
ncbi:hypothetical protein AgCh_030391 [Apium graveolens]